MRFIDRVRILARAGDGGNGVVAWRREAHVVYGGPAGGDGGRGGNIVLEADSHLSTLLDLKYRQHYRAASGRPGASKSMCGRSGVDTIIRVPVGTSVYLEGLAGPPGTPPPWLRDPDPESLAAGSPAAGSPAAGRRPDEPEAPSQAGEMEVVYLHEASDEVRLEAPEAEAPIDIMADGYLEIQPGQRLKPAKRPQTVAGEMRRRGELLGDLLETGDSMVVAHGGRGGRGNIHFRSSTFRAPDFAEQGTPGEAAWLRLELKLLADVGIVGFPNVGKSTLIRRISRARPEVGNYPFTTLVPQLGVVSLGDERSMVVADVPGLIEGASLGKGLGHEFLRHLERTRVLLHLVAPDPTPGRSPLRDLQVLEAELANYGDMFAGRPRVVAINKVDTPEAARLVRRLAAKLRERNIPLFPISAATGEGIPPLLEALWRRLQIVSAQNQNE